jgi:hypothetical protein
MRLKDMSGECLSQRQSSDNVGTGRSQTCARMIAKSETTTVRLQKVCMPNCRLRRTPQSASRQRQDLFRVLEGFPELSHDDEVDACSGALEMLNPQMNSWGFYEATRQRFEQQQAARLPGPPEPT